MLPRHRHARILDYLEEKGTLRSIEIADLTDVTVETVRRDLEHLHKKNLLVRTHGGAIARNHPARNLGVREREGINLERKERIAELAESFLHPKDVIFIDGSTTALQLARAISALDITVLTNANAVIDVLADKEGVEVVATGGRYDPPNRCCGGALAIHALTRYRIKTAFFSANGIDPVRGLSESNEMQAELKAAALDLVEHAVFLGDSSKAGVCSTYFFSRVDQIDTWITDSDISPEKLDHYRQRIPDVRVASMADPDPASEKEEEKEAQGLSA